MSNVYTNLPAALAEYPGNTSKRRTKDLGYFTQFRMSVNIGTVGSAGSIVGLQYSLDGGTNWNGLDNGTAAANSTLTQAIDAVGLFVTAYTNIIAAARVNNCLLRIASSGGDGVADPSISFIVEWK